MDRDAPADAVKPPDREDKVYAAHATERHRIEDAIRDEPATDLRDLAVEVIVLSGEGW